MIRVQHGQYYLEGTRKFTIRRHGHPDFEPERWMRVRGVVNHGKPCFLVYISTPKRKRIFRDTQREAYELIVTEAERRRLEGNAARELSEGQRVDAANALITLAGRTTLLEAAAFWVRHAAPPEPITVSECCKKLLSSPGKGGRVRAVTTSSTLKTRFTHFCKSFGKRPINELAVTNEVGTWFERQRFDDPQYRKNWHRVLSQLFAFAVRHKHAAQNPMTNIEAGFVPPAAVTIFEVSEVAKVMKLAHEHELTDYFALGFFAGFRPHEVMRLEWRHVDFQAGHIEILAKDTKTKIKHRFLPLHDNLRAWLLPIRKEKGPIVKWSAVTIARRRHKITEAIGLNEWPKDVARHCYASYRKPFVPKHDLATELGNQEEVIDTNYARPMPKQRAEAYWKIMPP